MNIPDYLLAGKPEAAPALLTLKGQHTYGEVRRNALAVTRYLLRTGGKKGDRVILIADSGLFWVAAYLGIMRAGMVCVPLPPRLDAADLEYICCVTEPTFMFVEAKHLAVMSAWPHDIVLVTDQPVPQAAQSLPTLEISLSNGGSDDGFPELAPDDLAALMFTSGSTGRPRGVMVSSRNIMANTDSIVKYLELTSRDRIMAVLPFHYCFGASLLHTHLKAGGSVVIDPRFMYPEKILQRMRETACTGFAGVPSHFQILLRKSSLSRTSFPDLRYVQQAGGPLAPTFIRELQQALPNKKIFVMYGQTEATARLSYLPPDSLETKLGSVGKGIPGVRLRVSSESGDPVTPGQTGEIVAEGDNIALGYWQDDQETAQHFRQGRLYTGDLATVDNEGFIYIVDRAQDFLKCGGKRVSCRQLENILLEHAELLEAAIIGVPDDVLGEVAVAYVVPRDPKAQPSSDQLTIYCKEHMPLAVVPKRFVILGSLPKNNSGKVMKPLLKQNAGSPNPIAEKYEQR